MTEHDRNVKAKAGRAQTLSGVAGKPLSSAGSQHEMEGQGSQVTGVSGSAATDVRILVPR